VKDAVLRLIEGAALPDIDVQCDRVGAVRVATTRPLASYSTGERMVWSLAESITGDADGLDGTLWAFSVRLDDQRKRAVVAAIATLFGIEEMS
jgi:hypothetical protein